MPLRLSIAHLLTWMTATAIVIAVVAPEPLALRPGQDANVASFLQHQRRLSQYLTVAISPIAGAGLTALALAYWQGRGGPPFPVHPGHWLLIVVGTITASVLVVVAVVRFARRFDSDVFPVANLVAVPGLVVSCIVIFQTVRAVQHPPRWRIALRVQVWSLLLIPMCCCFPVFFGQERWIPLLIAAGLYFSGPVSIAVAAALDVARGARYDVFHWAGAAAIPLLVIIWIGTTFMIRSL